MPGTLRPMTARERHEPHRVATQLELFFDLVAVIAIAAATAALHHAISEGHGTHALAGFVFVFVATWWAWMNYTWFASAFDNDDPLTRLLVMVIMGGFLIFAGGVTHIFETFDLHVGIVGWAVMRIGMILLWLRAARHNPGLARTCHRYALGIAVAQVGWIVTGLLVPPASAAFLALALVVWVIEFAVPVWAESAGQTPWHRHHIIERYGLLNIIVLGEVLLSVALTFGALNEGLEPGLIIAALTGLVLVFLMFWLYFCEHETLASDRNRLAIFWGYGHVLVFAAGAAMGAGIAAWLDLVSHHSHLAPGRIGLWIGVPLALYLFAIWMTRDLWLAGLGLRRWALLAMAAAILVLAFWGASPVLFVPLMVLALVWRVPFHRA